MAAGERNGDMRLITWLKEHRPSRDAMLRSRWMRPFASTLGDPSVWHFNRRSVARGVALGMFFGVAIPFLQAPAAALLAVPARANLAVAALVTFISNPFTTPFIYLAAYEVGRVMLHLEGGAAYVARATADNWFEQLTLALTNAPLPVAIGLFTLATLGAAIGFALIHLVWRLWVRQRLEARRERRLAQ
jgi:uncharacterized protein